MIGMGQCRGIRHIPANSTTTESDANDNGELVSWFLQYPDGSMGMLYTTPVSHHKYFECVLCCNRQCAIVYVFLYIENNLCQCICTAHPNVFHNARFIGTS